MRIIGVIDLRDGEAVHARGGRRDTYAAVRHAVGVTIDGDAVDLARVYTETLGIAEIYVADLNAIATATPNDDTIRDIRSVGAPLMLDAGVGTVEDARRITRTGADTIVVGLETLQSFEALDEICRDSPCPIAFSLDLRDGIPMNSDERMGASPEDLARQAVAAGATAIIVLDVARVGTGVGPDLQMLKRIRLVVRECAVFAGGGVRSADDLKQLSDIGCDGALVASALHDGRLTLADVTAARAF